MHRKALLRVVQSACNGNKQRNVIGYLAGKLVWFYLLSALVIKVFPGLEFKTTAHRIFDRARTTDFYTVSRVIRTPQQLHFLVYEVCVANVSLVLMAAAHHSH